MRFNPKWIIGKTVERVEMNPFESREFPERIGSMVAHDPCIYFTDGSSIAFSTEETEVGGVWH